MKIRDMATAIQNECENTSICKDCYYKNYCEKLLNDNIPADLELSQIEYIIYENMFGDLDIFI